MVKKNSAVVENSSGRWGRGRVISVEAGSQTLLSVGKGRSACRAYSAHGERGGLQYLLQWDSEWRIVVRHVLDRVFWPETSCLELHSLLVRLVGVSVACGPLPMVSF